MAPASHVTEDKQLQSIPPTHQLKWALAQENLILLHANNKGADEPAQSDQRLCYSLSIKYDRLNCFMQSFNILASLCS